MPRTASSLALALALLPAPAAADVTRAVYDLYYRGMAAGQVTVTVTRGAARVDYEAAAVPNWLARRFGRGAITERGAARRGDLRPLEYFYRDAGRGREYRYVYDWPNARVRVERAAGAEVLPLRAGQLDPAALALRLMRDLPRTPPNYSVLSRGRLRVYRFAAPVPERIEAAGEELEAWKLERTRGDARGSRILTWHDPARGQWMVRTVRYEDGAERVRLELARYERSAGP